MYDLEKHIAELKSGLEESWQKLNLDQKLEIAQKLEQEVNEPELWLNPKNARKKNAELSHLQDETHDWLILKTQLADIEELLKLESTDLKDEIENQLDAIAEKLQNLQKALRFTGKYDTNNAVIRITSGAGGTEAMDWAAMLERMYSRFFAEHNFKAQELERQNGEEAGIKTVAYEVTGTNVYGTLKSEHGVHRLVRLSPFNADHLRQTSFALVEVLPIIDQDTDFEINEKDLRIDVYRSGGHGGQGVNTTDSAVRITHIPTNTVVAIQNERSQIQNRAKAMEILKGKLAKMQQEQQAESIDKLRAGESAGWGQQIRNYVLHPYKLVKDTRTKYESKDPEAVLDGKLDDFIDAYLRLC